MVLPDFTPDGDLPAGVHIASWREFQERFGTGTSRRVWLSSRLEALLGLAVKTGKLRRIFVWGSFVTTKPSPKDLDIGRRLCSILYGPSYYSNPMSFGHASIGEEVLQWCRGLSNFKRPSKKLYCGTGAVVIQTDDQMLLAQQCINNLITVLLEARKVHSLQDYMRMAEPILLEVQQREQEILEYLAGELEQPVAS